MSKAIDDMHTVHASRLDEASQSLRSNMTSAIDTHSGRLEEVATGLRSDHTAIRSDLDAHAVRLNDVVTSIEESRKSIASEHEEQVGGGGVQGWWLWRW